MDERPTSAWPRRTTLDRLSGLAHSPEASEFPPYSTDGGWDEAFEADGATREAYAGVLDALSGKDLGELRASTAAELERAQVLFGAGGKPSTFPMDPIPRVIPRAEWSVLERGLAQRTRALGAFLVDAYGDRKIVEAGVVPARVIESADHFEPWMLGVDFNLAGCVVGVDVVRGDDGRLRVLEDNTRTPSGIAYMAATRAALDSHLDCEDPSSRLDPVDGFEMLGAALRAAAPDGRGDPSVALLSDGPENSAWWEHREIARRLGIAIVTPEDLVVRGRRLFAGFDNGDSRELQVVYRRTDEDRLRDDSRRATWLTGALLGPCRSGNLSVVNPLGAGLADDKLVHAYVDEMVRFYLDEEPLVPSVRTYDLGDPEVYESTMPRLGELVVKPRSGHGGAGVVVCPHATAEDRKEAADRVSAEPTAWIAQETVTLSTHPTVVDGVLAPRHVDMRPFVIGCGEDATAVPGALTRVAFEQGALIVNSSQNGGGKDTWILA
jgi:uncharacterized circularly permuted ATP-grasp superfamily protein